MTYILETENGEDIEFCLLGTEEIYIEINGQ